MIFYVSYERHYGFLIAVFIFDGAGKQRHEFFSSILFLLFKVFTEFLTILLLFFYVLVFWQQGHVGS